MNELVIWLDGLDIPILPLLDVCHDFKMRYINPATGGHAMPTISAFVQLLPRGFRGRGCRSTDATVFVGVEGKGRTHVGGQIFGRGPNDAFVVPGWYECRHDSDTDSGLFSCSDRVVQEQPGLWREARC